MNSRIKYSGVLVILILLLGCKVFHSKSYYYQEVFLYNDLNQFDVMGNGHWEVKNDIISCGAGEGFIQTDNKFQYFHLKTEFLADATVNSGIFFSCEGEEIGPTTCYEANIWDDHPNQDFRTGSLVTRQNPLNVVNTVNRWSSYEIKAEEGRIRIWINGSITADLEVDVLEESPVLFQKFGEGRVQFKNITIAQLQK